ncbi:sensor histidine kinase [Aureibaculum luteum]|uniref:sensor histidine kinase n=1 Tax=Aureibaculum luteum TaxID=1548456 RepID=UPI000E4B30B4|nr:histidine kinase [Aureibaculum luteum]
MSSIKNTPFFFGIPLVKHILFWLVVYTYFILTIDIEYYGSYKQAIEFRTILISIQIVIAYPCLYLLIPRYLNTKKYLRFSIGLFLLLVVAYMLFIYIIEFYYQPKYFVSTETLTKYDSIKGFWSYSINIQKFAGKSIKFLTPTTLLVIAKFYKEQQTLMQLNEQKKSSELNTLKHQLNPHFLFNTLNNLYALTLDKSDEAPEVIAKLSEMLDYMLYGCNNKYVALQKEIELIENYLALEKVRYGSRVTIQFDKNVDSRVNIAPLILLTFIENAFKHGVSQELKKAFINIEIHLKGNNIHFNIVNSIAENNVTTQKENIGLSNVKKQLDFLYHKTYSLTIKEENNRFNVDLKLPVK